ncbi:SDR family oxidoreductase [Piscinibacter sakaiensis]|uniref:SDR family oxidoreductase n=1 Tax=Piscinibacter sakaiensis TaxID=1547922 RepID=UPI003AB00BC9
MKQTHRMLDQQVAIVTGATSGIGRGVAKALTAAGATVAINHRGHSDDAQQLVDEIESAGGSALALQADVAIEADVVRMFDELIDRQGRVDILVANAGVQRDAPFAEMELKQWQAVIDINLTGQFLCCREAVRRFLRQPPSPHSKAAGKIINMSSVHELIPWAGHVNYAASKGGIMQLMKSLAQEVAEKRIRVNGIAPGAIKTPINEEAWDDEEALQKLLTLIPYGRIGEVEDIARAAVWLASDDSDYVTGTTLFVDGGMSLYPAFRDNG